MSVLRPCRCCVGKWASMSSGGKDKRRLAGAVVVWRKEVFCVLED
jgi:hypothetical protein